MEAFHTGQEVVVLKLLISEFEAPLFQYGYGPSNSLHCLTQKSPTTVHSCTCPDTVCCNIRVESTPCLEKMLFHVTDM